MRARSYFISAILPAMAGLILGELLMTRMFVLYQPALGAMAFLTVEIVGAFLIDFPMAFLSALTFTRKYPQTKPRDGILTGAAFVTTFLLLIVVMIVLRQFTNAFDLFGLYESLSGAIQTAREGFGGILPVMVLAFLAFEFLICMTAGLIGFVLGSGRSGVRHSAVQG